LEGRKGYLKRNPAQIPDIFGTSVQDGPLVTGVIGTMVDILTALF